MPNQERVWFAEFSFDHASGELRHGPDRVALEHQPSLILARLVRSAGQVVTRGELAESLWGGDTHVKFDDGLNYCIRQVRLALGDDPKSPRFIATVPRRGYQFVAPIVHDDPARGWSWLVKPAVVGAIAVACLAAIVAETRPNNHHESVVTFVTTVHDLIF